MQNLWANDTTFPNGVAQGADPIIGQGMQPDPIWRPGCGEPARLARQAFIKSDPAVYRIYDDGRMDDCKMPKKR